MNDYKTFERLMDEDQLWRDRGLDFSTICKMHSLDEVKLEKMIEQELGYDGDGLLEAFRTKII